MFNIWKAEKIDDVLSSTKMFTSKSAIGDRNKISNLFFTQSLCDFINN